MYSAFPQSISASQEYESLLNPDPLLQDLEQEDGINIGENQDYMDFVINKISYDFPPEQLNTTPSTTTQNPNKYKTKTKMSKRGEEESKQKSISKINQT